MSHLESKELIQAEQLSDEGKLDEALTLLNNYEQKEGLTNHEKVSCHLLQCQILFWQGKLKELIKHAKQLYKESEELENISLKVDCLLLMTYALVRLGKIDKASDLIKQGEELIKTIPQELTKAYKQREAYLAFIKGHFYSRRRKKNDADLALKHLEHSLALREELGIKHEIAETLSQMAFNLCAFKGEMNRALNYAKRGVNFAEESTKKYYIAFSLSILAVVYTLQGDLDSAIRFYKQSVALYKEINNKDRLSDVLNNLSNCYKMRGELDRALECIEQSITLNRELGSLIGLAWNHDYLIQILIDKGDHERAQNSLRDLEQLNNQLKDKLINLMYLLDKALVLKTSPRALNRGKAEELLKQLLEEKDIIYEFRLMVLLNLCDLLLMELQISNEAEVLAEIKPLIAEILDLSEKSHSFWVLGETYLLQAKLALISLNLEEAQRLLTQGQKIAEKFGLTRLAMSISEEHDKLLNELSVWEGLKESNAPMGERIELARLADQVKSMTKKRVKEYPRLEAEQPILFAIMTKEGEMVLSSPFTADMTIDETHFGEFLSSCNTFCDQIFSESFDRVKFGQYTILISAIEHFCIYYMFQGHSYSAQQKLSHFCETFDKDPTIMKILENFINENKIIAINEHPSLENLIVESFLSDPQKFQMPFKAYEGDEPFVFVSYAHTDKLQVYPIIDFLNKKGIHIWYDEGIPISENWKKSIVENLERCKAFLLFITPHILDSDYVRKEISFASKRQKTFFGVYLKETELPSELEFDIADIQSIKKYLMSDSDFYPKLREVISPALYEHDIA